MPTSKNSDNSRTEQSPLGAAAVAYAKRGWPVFPTAPRTKIPLKGSHGYLDASSDPALTARRWALRPQCNIALWCRDFLVIDRDPRNGGDWTWEALMASEADSFCLDTRTTRTPSGGQHDYFLQPSYLRYTIGSLGPGVDIKTASGYTLLPPSVGPNGKPYRWLDEHSEIAQLPVWLNAVIARAELAAMPPESADGATPKPPAGLRPTADYLIARALWEAERTGSRNKGGLWLACQLRDNGYTRAEAETVRRAWVAEANRA